MARPPWLPEALLVPHPSFAPSALVIGAETFARVGPFDTTLQAGSDSDCLFRAKDEGEPLAMLPETLVIRRIHRYNHSHETGLLRAEMLRLVRTSIARQRAGPGDTGHGGDGATV